MVGTHLQHAFRSWFKETEKDGTPLLPVQLSKKYTVLPQILGQGSFAVVKAVAERATGEQRALKIIAKKPLKDNNEQMLKEEITILGKVDHPNIIKMWDLYESKEAVFIVTDLCRGGELFDRLVEKVHYNELDARHSMKQIMDGVAYLHERDIIHRDLKPENILLRDQSDPSDVVISDFGLSRFIPDEGLLMTACGSPQYVSPEVLLGKGYNSAVDIWSCGVIAFALLGGYTPFYGDDQPTLFKRIIEMQVEFEPEYWSEISDLAKDFILRCLCPADKRMTAKEALAHPWLDQLPPLHEEKSKGACLKDGALRNMTSIRKLRKAVTAIEALNHLNHLQSLRQQHGEALPHKQLSLRSMASTLELYNSEQELRNKKPSGDSAMSLDLTVMMVTLDEQSDKATGTAAVAQAMQSTVNRGRDASSPEGTPKSSSGGAPRRASRSGKQADSESAKTLNSLLDQYKKTELPSSARLDPYVKTREPAKMTLTNAWRYLPFLVQQGVTIGSAVASHAIYGPPKKSWGIEMSVFTRMLRDAAIHSEFASIAGLQQFFDLGALLPTPKDGLITPVTFRVKKRGLRGFLAEADAAEDGKREITAEWVVGKQTWRRLQSEWRSGKQKGKERVILYIHGGAYFIMSAATHRPLTISLSKYTECRVFGINYRLAPGTKFPGALHDCVASWFRLTDDLGIPPSNIVLGADSAGGGLALALMYYLRDNKYEMPSGAMLFSPWVDLTMSCDSWETNAAFDYLPMPVSGDHMNPVAAYLGENIDKYLTHPYASPLFGDMHGLPPLLIQCGDAEVLRDEVTLLAHKASLSGVAVRHELYEDCVHVFQAFLFLDASRKALQSARHFVRTALDKRGKTSIGKDTQSALNKEMGGSSMQTPEGDAADAQTGNAKSNTTPSAASADKDNKVDGGIDEIATLPHSNDDDDDGDDDAPLPSNEEDWELERGEDASPGVEAKVASLPSKAAQKVMGTDNEAVTEATDEGTQAAQAKESGSSSGFPAMSIEEARVRGEAAMQQQLSSNAPALSKFHAPQKPLTPRMRRTGSEKQLTGLLKSFQEASSGLKTNVWTPDA